MRRREFLKTSSAAVSMAAVGTQAAFGKSSKLPNILLILSDDHSTPDLGCYGNKTIRTPYLDGLADTGMRFNRAYTSAPQCSPSRASILTGLSPQRTCMTRLATPLPPEHITFPEILKKSKGYFTGVCGRWHHMDGRARPKEKLAKIYKRRNLQSFSSRVDYCNGSGFRLEYVQDFLEKAPKEKPFFLQVGFNDPHYKWDTDAIPNSHKPDEIELPAHLPDLPSLRDSMARHYDEIARMDAQIGLIIKALKDHRVEENTLVLFMGDNGQAFPHGKGTLYQPGTNVPFILSWPGVVKSGTLTDELISGVDLAPTFLDLAECRIADRMEGNSFKRLLTGDHYAGRDYIFTSCGWHNREGTTPLDSLDMSRGVTSRTHSLIYNCLPNQPYRAVDFYRELFWKEMQQANAQGKLDSRLSEAYFRPARPIFEMFDLEKDPSELNNMAGTPSHEMIEEELKEALDAWMQETYDFLPPPITA